MIVTQQASAHFGNDYLENVHSTKNQPQRTVEQVFDVTRKLVKEQKEIQGFSMINWQENSWKKTNMLTDRAVRLSTAKACVFSDSALCMGRMIENPVKARTEKIDWFMNSSQCGNFSQESLLCGFSPRSRT